MMFRLPSPKVAGAGRFAIRSQGKNDRMTGLEWKLDSDRRALTLTVSTNPPVVLTLDAAQTDEMLENLGRFRAAMTPGHSATFAPGQKVVCARNPAWLAELDMMQGDSLLHLRDPHFGWRHYLIPREEAKKLADVLRNQVEAPIAAMPENKPN